MEMYLLYSLALKIDYTAIYPDCLKYSRSWRELYDTLIACVLEKYLVHLGKAPGNAFACSTRLFVSLKVMD
jgi:hypothetical protein